MTAPKVVDLQQDLRTVGKHLLGETEVVVDAKPLTAILSAMLQTEADIVALKAELLELREQRTELAETETRELYTELARHEDYYIEEIQRMQRELVDLRKYSQGLESRLIFAPSQPVVVNPVAHQETSWLEHKLHDAKAQLAEALKSSSTAQHDLQQLQQKHHDQDHELGDLRLYAARCEHAESCLASELAESGELERQLQTALADARLRIQQLDGCRDENVRLNHQNQEKELARCAEERTAHRLSLRVKTQDAQLVQLEEDCEQQQMLRAQADEKASRMDAKRCQAEAHMEQAESHARLQVLRSEQSYEKLARAEASVYEDQAHDLSRRLAARREATQECESEARQFAQQVVALEQDVAAATRRESDVEAVAHEKSELLLAAQQSAGRERALFEDSLKAAQQAERDTRLQLGRAEEQERRARVRCDHLQEECRQAELGRADATRESAGLSVQLAQLAKGFELLAQGQQQGGLRAPQAPQADAAGAARSQSRSPSPKTPSQRRDSEQAAKARDHADDIRREAEQRLQQEEHAARRLDAELQRVQAELRRSEEQRAREAEDRRREAEERRAERERERDLQQQGAGVFDEPLEQELREARADVAALRREQLLSEQHRADAHKHAQDAEKKAMDQSLELSLVQLQLKEEQTRTSALQQQVDGLQRAVEDESAACLQARELARRAEMAAVAARSPRDGLSPARGPGSPGAERQLLVEQQQCQEARRQAARLQEECQRLRAEADGFQQDFLAAREHESEYKAAIYSMKEQMEAQKQELQEMWAKVADTSALTQSQLSVSMTHEAQQAQELRMQLKDLEEYNQVLEASVRSARDASPVQHQKLASLQHQLALAEAQAAEYREGLLDAADHATDFSRLRRALQRREREGEDLARDLRSGETTRTDDATPVDTGGRRAGSLSLSVSLSGGTRSEDGLSDLPSLPSSRPDPRDLSLGRESAPSVDRFAREPGERSEDGAPSPPPFGGRLGAWQGAPSAWQGPAAGDERELGELSPFQRPAQPDPREER